MKDEKGSQILSNINKESVPATFYDPAITHLHKGRSQ